MSLATATLWHERRRFLPGVLAVAFSAVLMALQGGLLLGLFSLTSIPVDFAKADIWVGSPGVVNVDVGRPIPQSHLTRMADLPGVGPPEMYVQGFSYWNKEKTAPDGERVPDGTELCVIIGTRLDDDAIGPVKQLRDRPDLRAALTEFGAVVLDEADLKRFNVKVGDYAQVNGEDARRVRIVGTVSGLKGLAGAYVFASVPTAQALLRISPVRDKSATYLVATCPDERLREEAVARLKAYDDMSAFSADEFSVQTRWHWLTKTKAGVALGYAALLGLLVGAVVTSQTLFAATMASMREFAVLLALGIPRWRVAGTVVVQSFWVGVLGTAIGIPAVFLLAQGATAAGAPVLLPNRLILAAAVVTMVMAVGSGLAALRAIRLIEPTSLLR